MAPPKEYLAELRALGVRRISFGGGAEVEFFQDAGDVIDRLHSMLHEKAEQLNEIRAQNTAESIPQPGETATGPTEEQVRDFEAQQAAEAEKRAALEPFLSSTIAPGPRGAA